MVPDPRPDGTRSGYRMVPAPRPDGTRPPSGWTPSSEGEASPTEIEVGDASEEGGFTPAGSAATLRHPEGGFAADSGSPEEGTPPPYPPSGGNGAEIHGSGETVLAAGEERLNGEETASQSADPIEREPEQLQLGIPQHIRNILINDPGCNWYQGNRHYTVHDALDMPRPRPRRPRFEPQVVPPPPVERDTSWEKVKAARERLAEDMMVEGDSDDTAS